MAQLKVQLRLMLGAEIALGPGKADLLAAIAEYGSISAAGAQLGMSYLRTWKLVDTMNRCFRQPLVETATGGSGGGGAQLSDLGLNLLQRYRAMQAAAEAATLAHQPEFLASLARTTRKPAAKKAAAKQRKAVNKPVARASGKSSAPPRRTTRPKPPAP